MASQLARQLGPREGHWGCTQKWYTYIHMHDRVDKLCSALAEAQLKTKVNKHFVSNGYYTRRIDNYSRHSQSIPSQFFGYISLNSFFLKFNLNEMSVLLQANSPRELTKYQCGQSVHYIGTL